MVLLFVPAGQSQKRASSSGLWNKFRGQGLTRVSTKLAFVLRK